MRGSMRGRLPSLDRPRPFSPKILRERSNLPGNHAAGAQYFRPALFHAFAPLYCHSCVRPREPIFVLGPKREKQATVPKAAESPGRAAPRTGSRAALAREVRGQIR